MYEPGATSGYPLLLSFDGAEYLDEIPLPKMLDSLLAASRILSIEKLRCDVTTRTCVQSCG